MLPLILAIVVTVFDQWTKSLVRGHFDLFENRVVVAGLFDLRYIQNTGAAWGMFAGGHYWLAGLSLLVLFALVIWQRAFFRNCLLDRMAFGLLAGGIVGNLIDRIRLRYVVDFLDFHWGGRHFPAFNIADSAICIGVGMVLISQYLVARAEDRSGPSGAGE
ncbi:MAG: signal peptidase II [Kiritimatiellia bacterium]